MICFQSGVWLSLARALRSGRRGRRFKSSHPDHFFDSLPTIPLDVFFVFVGEIKVKITNLQYRRESGFFAFATVFFSHRAQILRRVKVVGFSIGEVKVVETHFEIRPFDFLSRKMKFSVYDIL